MPSDVHTDAEDRLYRFMRNAGRPVSPGVREFAGNMTLLAEKMGRDDRSVRRIVQSLIEKLSIAIGTPENFRTGVCRTYLVYEYDIAQERRIAAGLCYAIKNKGIALLTEYQARELIQREFATVSSPDSTPPDDTIDQTVSTPDDTIVPSGDNTAVLSPDNTHTVPYIRNKKLKKATAEENTTSSTDAVPAAEIVNAIRKVVGRCDDQGANTIIRKCRSFAPEAPDEHIVSAIDTFANEIRAKKGSIESPMGYLIRYVPSFFQGESYRQFVSEQNRQKRLAREEELKAARLILADGDGSDEILQWARKVLAEAGEAN